MSRIKLIALVFSIAALLPVIDTPAALGAPAAAETVAVETRLTQNSFHVGDQVGLQVIVMHPRETLVQFPTLQGKLGSAEALGFKALTPLLGIDGTQTSTGEYAITSFLPGQFTLPLITVTYTNTDGSPASATSTQPIAFEVVSVLTGPVEEPLRDIKPPLAIAKVPTSYTNPIAWTTLVLGSLALAAITARRIKASRRRPVPVALGRTLEDVTREELDRIGAMGLVDQGRYSDYCNFISAAVRNYIDQRFELEFTASTTTEIRGQRLQERLGTWETRVVVGLLEECDAIRWAHYHPDPQRAARLLNMAYEILDLTAGEPAEVANEALAGREAR